LVFKPYSTTELAGRLVCQVTVALVAVMPLTLTPVITGAGLVAVVVGVGVAVVAVVEGLEVELEPELLVPLELEPVLAVLPVLLELVLAGGVAAAATL
jgi:hypothetical protein